MKNKKKKFSSQKAVLILLQQLQAKNFGNINASIDIDLLSSNSIDVWLGKGKNLENITFSSASTPEAREETYNELLTLIGDRL